jgi:UDP-glucose 4-epimerase
MTNSNKTILVTGGAGYIGSHTCLELLLAGFSVVVLDNFSNSSPQSLRRVETLALRNLIVIEGDVRDEEITLKALQDHRCDAVIHFAGLKAVGQSVSAPIGYYDNNVVGAVSLLRAMKQAEVKTLVFSSSATVYGEPEYLPLNEDHRLQATNPYGRTKLFIEEILRDLFVAEPDWRISILRYFNPVGAHESGSIGEDPRGTPNNLMPFVAQVAVGRRDRVNIWGNDYNTSDGTGVRDYIHVVDLAMGHIKALENLTEPQCRAINLGTGKGLSVLEIIDAFERVCGKKINYQFAPRRPGDVASCFADTTLAEKLLNWRAERNLADMCRDACRWQWDNPDGYASA